MIPMTSSMLMKRDFIGDSCLTRLMQLEEKRAGGKKSKEQITLLVCANMKRPLLTIGKSKSPRCFQGSNSFQQNMMLTHVGHVHLP